MKLTFKNHTEHTLELRGVVKGEMTPALLEALQLCEVVIYVRDVLPADALQATEESEDPDPQWAEREPPSERAEWAEDGD